MPKILGVKEGRPKIPSSFAVMASVSNAKTELPEYQKHAFLTFRFPTEAFPRRFLSVAHSFVQHT